MIRSSGSMGLANNLKSLVSARNLFGGVCVDWSRHNFSNLFHGKRLGVGCSDGFERSFFSYRFMLRELEGLCEDFNLYYFPGARDDGRNIDHMFSLIPSNVRDVVVGGLWSLGPLQLLLDKCEDFYARHCWDVSVHYRCFDTDSWDSWSFGFDDSELAELLSKFPRRKIFVASDNFKRGVEFGSRCGHDCVFFRDPSLSWEQLAFCDMLLLGRGKLLFTPQFSTFSELSWFWGGCVQDVCNYKSGRYLLDFETVWHEGC
jgi:hypothetical protein